MEFVGGVRSRPETAELAPMLKCVSVGREGMDWDGIASKTPLDVLRAATMLSPGAAVPGCAEDGFRAVFESDSASLSYRWGAFLGLQGILAAEGRTTDLRAVVDSAMATGIDLASQLYMLDALAGVDVAAQATEVAKRLSTKPRDQPRLFTLWLLGAWRAQNGDRAGTQAARDAIEALATSERDPWAARLAAALNARLALLDGDTAATVNGLSAVLGVGRRDVLDWDLSESLAPERLLLAELQLARGRFAEALAVGGMFDHPAPVVFLPFLPASLAIREQAARALGRDDEAKRLHERLVALGHIGDSARDSSPTRKAEVP